jgi:hypothetical protein
MREVSIPIPGGFPVIISVWITGAVLCQALGNVSAGSWGSVWIQRSGVIVIQVRNCIMFSPRFDTFSGLLKLYNKLCVYACVHAGANAHLSSEAGRVVRLWAERSRV